MKNESNKESMLLKLQTIVEKQEVDKTDVESHFIMCFECDAEGHINGQLTKMDASPVKALGMVELAMFELKTIKKRIQETITQQKESGRGMISKDHPAVKESFEKFKGRLAKAVKDGDIEALRALKQEIKEDFAARTGMPIPDEDSDDEKPFDINDFKGM